MLDEDLEDCPHSLGVNQSLELKPCLKLFRLALTRIVEITELVLFAKGQKKSFLRREAGCFEAKFSASVD